MKKSKTKYSVSAVICHHKGDLIFKAIESLQKSREVELEIIVVTTGDENVSRLRNKYPDCVVVSAEGGPATKRNVGCRLARHPLYAFFDDDVEVTPYACFYLARTLNKSDVGATFGKLLNMEHRNRFDEAGSFLTWSGFLYARCESGIEDTGQFQEEVPILAGKSASMMIRRKCFWQVGGYDESYEILGEETDLAWRVWLSGMSVMWCPKSVTYHAFNTRFKPADFYVPRRVYYNGCRNYLTMIITNLAPANLIIPLVVQTLTWSLAGLGFFLTGKFEASKNVFYGLGYVITNLKSIIKKRQIVQRMRVVRDRDLLPIVTHNPPPSYYLKRFVHYIQTGRHG